MNELNLQRRVKITTGLTWLLLIGSDAAAAIIALTRNSSVVLIPLSIATLVSFGMVWWAYHCNGD